MEVILNKSISKVYENIHREKRGVFEDHFKADNDQDSTDNNVYSRVKYYDLTVSH